MKPLAAVDRRGRAGVSRPSSWWRRGTATGAALLLSAAMVHVAVPGARAAPRSAGCGQPSSGGVTTGSVPFGDKVRLYRLAAPVGPGPFPLVLNFHGLGSNAFQQAVYSQLEQK